MVYLSCSGRYHHVCHWYKFGPFQVISSRELCRTRPIPFASHGPEDQGGGWHFENEGIRQQIINLCNIVNLPWGCWVICTHMAEIWDSLDRANPPEGHNSSFVTTAMECDRIATVKERKRKGSTNTYIENILKKITRIWSKRAAMKRWSTAKILWRFLGDSYSQ